jgi:hypothetical protein
VVYALAYLQGMGVDIPSPPAEATSKRNYYSLIARAVAGLDTSTRDSRQALYERARAAQLNSIDPALSPAATKRERDALEQAIRTVEFEAAPVGTERRPKSGKHVHLFKEAKLSLRAARRLGAFKRARRQGMSIDQARNYSDIRHPPTPDDIAYEQKLREGGSFPWLSALSLLYPISAMIYIATSTPAPIVTILGYGLAQLGYLFFAATLISGKFGVFGLKNRWQVLIAGVISLCLGISLSNI